MMTIDEALARLAKFKTVDGLARFLQREGIKGEASNGSRCPITMWLRKVTGLEYVHTTSTVVHPHGYMGDGITVVPLPSIVTAFIKRFDYGTHHKPNRRPYKYLRM